MSNRISQPNPTKPLGLDDIIHLKKYKGQLIRDVIQSDSEYLLWAHNDTEYVPWFKLQDDVLKEAEEYAAAERDERSANAQAYAEGYGSDDDPRDYDPFEGMFGGPDEGDGYDEYK